MGERAHLMKAEQPRNLGYMQLAVVEVTNRQIAPQLLKDFGEVQPFVRKLSCKCPLAHSQTASDVSQDYSSMWKQRRNRILNSGAQLAQITFSMGQRRFAIFQEEVIEITVRVNERQLTCADVQGKLVCVTTELYVRSDKSGHFGVGSRSMVSNEKCCGARFCPVSTRQIRNTANMQNSI